LGAAAYFQNSQRRHAKAILKKRLPPGALFLFHQASDSAHLPVGFEEGLRRFDGYQAGAADFDIR
jgi:hypothetical protein